MSDIALRWDLDLGAADIAIEDDDVATDAGLRTAVLQSLFLDRRAEYGDTLPAADGDQRGWWGDEFAEVEGDLIGSRLWLLDRGKRTSDVVPRVEELARESLAWLIEDRVANRIDVTVTVDGHVLSLGVTIYRPQRDPTTFRFSHVWDGEEANAV